MEKDGTVRIGIDDFLQHVTGTLTKIKFRETGGNVRRDEKIFRSINERYMKSILEENGHNI